MRLNLICPVWVLCLLLAACQTDPMDNPGTWKAPDKGFTSNDQNLRAMLVDPQDLNRGKGESTSESVTAARAARRQLAGQRTPLPNANTMANPTANQQQSQPGQQQQGAGSAAHTE
jgi:hypothetical protein